MLKIKSAVLAAICAFTIGSAQAAELNPSHPERYVVQQGDTLWDIASRFLRHPWEWPEIWHVNQQVTNPHLIYPGDMLVLSYDANGNPRLTRSGGKRTVRLSPNVRRQPLAIPIPMIPLEAVAPFMTQPIVASQEELEGAPYVVDFDDAHLAAGAGQKIYARRLQEDAQNTQNFIRIGKPYRDGETDELLGVHGDYIGAGRIVRKGDPATVTVSSSTKEVLIGDRLFPAVEEELNSNFVPRSPDRDVRGRIIRVLGGVSQIGQLQVVALDRGSVDGLDIGHVLQIDQAGEVVRDLVTKNPRDTVKLPDERAGYLMVFRTFERVSFALVLDARRAIHLNDVVRNPEA